MCAPKSQAAVAYNHVGSTSDPQQQKTFSGTTPASQLERQKLSCAHPAYPVLESSNNILFMSITITVDFPAAAAAVNGVVGIVVKQQFFLGVNFWV